MTPKPDPAARFWDWIARRYARQPIGDEASYRQKLKVAQGYFRPDMAAVEIGCGTGSTAIEHAPHLKRILALDISAKMLEIARERAAQAGVENVEFTQASARDLSALAADCDVVMAYSILHLVEDRDAVIRDAFRILKPGGVFVTSTACLADGMNWLRPIAWIGRRLGLLPAVTFFSREDLRASIRAAGLEIDHDWRPGPRKAVFIVALKPA